MGSSSSLNHVLIAAIQHLPTGIFWKDLEGRYLGCNQHCIKLSDLASEQFIIGKTDQEFKLAGKGGLCRCTQAPRYQK